MFFVLARSFAQTQPPVASSPPNLDAPTLHTGTSLTLVDVIAEQSSGKLHTRQLLTELKQTDFRLFDNDHEVTIRGFDVGIQHTIRPVALWLVVQCNQGFPIGWSSGFIRNKTHWLTPALAALQPTDVIGVAHWCDDGTVELDVPPSTDGTKALATIETILHAKANAGENRLGERALQKLFIDVLAATEKMSPARLPVFLFLYGDHSATYVNEARDIIQSLLESSGIVFGLNDPASEANPSENLGDAGQISHLIHHYAAETGGQYLSTADPALLASALAYMLTEVHLRYVLSFRPATLDGKRHSLKVELTKSASKTFGNPELRFRTEYIPIPRKFQAP